MSGFDVARDRDNRVVILTGTGDEWSGVPTTPGQSAIGPPFPGGETPPFLFRFLPFFPLLCFFSSNGMT
jgi:hypothetical protein